MIPQPYTGRHRSVANESREQCEYRCLHDGRCGLSEPHEICVTLTCPEFGAVKFDGAKLARETSRTSTSPEAKSSVVSHETVTSSTLSKEED